MNEKNKVKALVDAETAIMEQLVAEQFLEMDGIIERAMGEAMRNTLRRLGLWNERYPADQQTGTKESTR